MELAQLVIEITGSSSVIEYRDLPVDAPTQRCPDITLARSALGWEPRTALRQGLALAVEWFASLEHNNGASLTAALGN